ncbi:MAG: hypothetical protein KA010_01895 [Saprospiraceae bacterium]|nr:hypothetical protein [Saprospiraceae bacterium]
MSILKNQTNSDCLSIDIIEKYINNDLSSDKVRIVEQHILDCEMCDNALSAYTDNPSLIGNAKEMIATSFASSSKEPKKRESSKIFALNSTIMRVAAGLLILIISVATFTYWKQNKDIRLVNNFLNIKEMPSADFSVRGDDDKVANIDQQLQYALDLYIQKNYEHSYYNFKEYLDDHPENLMANYYGGLAALEYNQLDDARNLLRIAYEKSDDFREDACWYLALATVKSGRMSEAKILLDEIIKNPENYYYTDAQQLMKELDQL